MRLSARRLFGSLFLSVIVAACSDSKQSNGAASDATAGDDTGDDAGAASLDPDIVGMVAAIAQDRIASSITTLAGMGTRSSCSDATGGTQGIGAARDWIKAQMSAVNGLQVRLDPYDQTGCGTATLPRDNVVGVLPGAHPERIVVVGGHYDSRTVNVADGTSPAPGANDSGSQTSLVLEAARAMAGHSFDATLVFIAFAGEEQGLVGSASFAKSVKTAFPNGVVEAMLNCDIVGGDSTINDANALQQFRLFSPGTPREVLGPDGTTDDTSPSRGLMRYVGVWGSAFVPDMTMLPKLREDRPGRGGDHESFIAEGYPGVRLIEPNEDFSHQHTANDLVMYVTPSYTTRITQLVVAVAASLARAPSAPIGIMASGGADVVDVSWSPPAVGAADHYVLAARAVSDNLYAQRVRVAASATSASFKASDLGIDGGGAFFVSVAAVDAAGHESLFAYPEYRCEGAACAVPASALDITAKN
jgi:hypothetical protein